MNVCQLADRQTAKEVITAVADYAWNRHSTLTRSDVDKWNPTPEEWATYEFYGGYLVISVDNVYIDSVEEEYGEQVWYVWASLYTGDELLGDPDLYSAYKGEDGKWIVEWDSC